MTPLNSQHLVVAAAWAAAAAGTVLGQVHALARHATAEGREDLEYGVTRLWSEPASQALRPVLDWADADTVYLTYGKVWFPVFLAFSLAAYTVYRHRRPSGVERLVWRASLLAYALGTVSSLGYYYSQWTGYNSWGETFFAVVTVPALLLMALTSTVLGVLLLRRRYRPRLTAWLLTLFIPFAVLVTQVTSMGSVALPLMWGWALAVSHAVPANAQVQASGPGRLVEA